MPDISLVILFSAEEKKVLLDCIRAVRKSCGSLSCEIIVVNNSREDPAFIKAYFSDVRVIDNRNNLGVAKGRNQGARISGANIIMFLDADIILENNSIAELYDYLLHHSEIDVIAPKLISLQGNIHYNFGKPAALAFPFYEILNIFFGRPKEIIQGFYDFLGGGCLMFRRDAWDKVGEYDENFFYGFEDADWARRAVSKRIRLFYYPKVKALHLLHQAVKTSGARQVDFYVSEVYYYRKYYGAIFAFLLKIFIITFSFFRLVVLFFKPEKHQTRKLIIRLIKRLASRSL